MISSPFALICSTCTLLTHAAVHIVAQGLQYPAHTSGCTYTLHTHRVVSKFKQTLTFRAPYTVIRAVKGVACADIGEGVCVLPASPTAGVISADTVVERLVVNLWGGAVCSRARRDPKRRLASSTQAVSASTFCRHKQRLRHASNVIDVGTWRCNVLAVISTTNHPGRDGTWACGTGDIAQGLFG